MRYFNFTRVGALAASLTFLLAACGSNDEPSASGPDKPDYASAERTNLPVAKRANEYNTTAELQRDSTLVVVATGTGKVTRDIAEGPGDPMAITTAVIDKVISGEGYKAGDEISIFAEGRHDENGQLQQDKIKGKKKYVLYLTPYRKESQGQIFAVTGYLAGMYESVAPNQYGRVDPESPDLPRGLDLSGAGVREITR